MQRAGDIVQGAWDGSVEGRGGRERGSRQRWQNLTWMFDLTIYEIRCQHF